MEKAKFFSISFDESKAMDEKEYMSITIYYVDMETGKPRTVFLKLHEVHYTDVEALTEELVGFHESSSVGSYCLTSLIPWLVFRSFLKQDRIMHTEQTRMMPMLLCFGDTFGD